MFRLCRIARAIGSLLQIRAHELAYRDRVVLERTQSGLDLLHQRLKGGEVAVVGLGALDVAPEVLDRVGAGQVVCSTK